MNEESRTSNPIERRFLAGLELRAEESGDKRILKGYAARFNKLSQNLGGFREQLMGGCFSRSLRRNPDVAMLSNHDQNQILARCSAGNLEVAEDSAGLRFRAELPNTHLAEDVFENVRAGNIRGMSFAMRVKSDQWDDVDDEPDDPDDDEDDPKPAGRIARRTVLECDLSEISCTPWPAYQQTKVSAAARALWPGGVPSEIRAHIEGAEHNAQLARLKRIGDEIANDVSEEEANFRCQMRVKAAGLLLDS